MNFCSNCGTEVKQKERKFCANCGNEVAPTHDTAQAAATSIPADEAPVTQGMSGGAKFLISIIIIALVGVVLYTTGVFDNMLDRKQEPGFEYDDDGFRFRNEDGDGFDFKWKN